MNDRMKAALKATDDEWAVIQPLLEKVETAQRATMAGRFGGFGGFGRRGGGGRSRRKWRPGGAAAQGAMAAPAAAEARRGKPRESPGPVQFAGSRCTAHGAGSRTALRTKRSKQSCKRCATRGRRRRHDLEQAREDLKKVLTLRQEATLVQMGILE